MKNKAKRAIIIFLIAALIYYECCVDYKYRDNEFIDDNDYNNHKLRYSKGYLYIGDKEYIESIRNEVTENDIIIIDERHTRNPNLIIENSYLIKNKEIRNEILQLLINYESYHPTDWDRTIESMRLEWYVHNVLYELDYRIDHTADVDLDNEDEEKYQNDIFNKLLKL